MVRKVNTSIKYEKKLSKFKGTMRWLVIERPTGSIVSAYTFEDEAQTVVDFQNKNRVWAINGGFPTYIALGKI